MRFRGCPGIENGGRRPNPTQVWAGSGVLALAALIAMALVLGPAASAASPPPSLDVFVGYADSDRASALTFPTPWDDPSNPVIIFEGCQPASRCTFDGGAVRLVNNSSSPVTVNSVKVEYSHACVYDIWPHNVTLAPRKQLIVTQLKSTATGVDSGCTNTTNPAASGYGHMDGSDIGPNGADWDRVCTQSGVIPQVDVKLNGSTTASTFADTGQVLNTRGVDAAFCPSPPGGVARNESIPWTPIGAVPCPGTALTVAPPTQTEIRGGTATVTARLVGGCGNPLQGSKVHFHIFGKDAPNSDKGSSGTTDSHGNVKFTYRDTKLGRDEVQADVSNPAGRLFSNVVVVTWVNGTSKGPRSVITKLSVRPTSFVAAPSGPSVVPASTRRFGTLLSYHDSHPAIATFTVLKAMPGRRQGSLVLGPPTLTAAPSIATAWCRLVPLRTRMWWGQIAFASPGACRATDSRRVTTCWKSYRTIPAGLDL